MKIKNLVIYDENQSKLERLRAEYRDYCGFDCQLLKGKLIVYAVPRAARKPERAKKKEYSGAM